MKRTFIIIKILLFTSTSFACPYVSLLNSFHEKTVYEFVEDGIFAAALTPQEVNAMLNCDSKINTIAKSNPYEFVPDITFKTQFLWDDANVCFKNDLERNDFKRSTAKF
jgi:hypothetical protein